MSRNIAAILRTVELAKQQRVKRRHTAPVVVDERSPEEIEHAEILSFQAEIDRLDNDNFIPDPMGQHKEPASIYSPAPPGRITREAPKRRKGRDPLACGTDCELPEYRRKQSYVIEDASGRARGVININPFSKRIQVGGFGLTTRR